MKRIVILTRFVIVGVGCLPSGVIVIDCFVTVVVSLWELFVDY